MWQIASGNSITARSTTFFCAQEIIEIGKEQLGLIKQAAIRDPLKRARLCLHHNHSDKVQEMVIAFCRDSYVRPHRHLNKSESFHVIEGDLAVVFFNNEGNVINRIKMSPCGNGQTFLYRLSSSLWHMVIPLSEFVVIHETTTGPFLKEETENPTWGPVEADADGIRAFLEKITT
jgi:cupin fold WbuC family metalloprotein